MGLGLSMLERLLARRKLPCWRLGACSLDKVVKQEQQGKAMNGIGCGTAKEPRSRGGLRYQAERSAVSVTRAAVRATSTCAATGAPQA